MFICLIHVTLLFNSPQFVWIGLWRLNGATTNFVHAEASLAPYDHTSKSLFYGQNKQQN